MTSDTGLLLPGIALRGYRSLHAPGLQVLSPLSKVNLLAGQNNAGKSNILQFIKKFLNNRGNQPDQLDVPVGEDPTTGFTMAIARRITDDEVKALLTSATRIDPRQAGQMLLKIFSHPAMRLATDDAVWFQFRLAGRPEKKSWGTWKVDPIQVTEIARQFAGNEHLISNVTSALFSHSGSLEDNVRMVLDRFSPLPTLPSVEVVEAFRQIRPSADPQGDISPNGEGLVRGLQRLERPSIDRRDDKRRFEAINRFVQTVLEDSTAELEIPYDAATILVRRGSRTLPLEHLGTGIHQVIILAAAATLFENRLVCVEEPEVHLHPLLQRKLVRYLKEETNNQYLIATHSAHLLDHEHSSVFHVQLTERGTEVQHAGTPQKLFSICADLGYRPSDLLQANAIIWVEGPSDRIYVRRWIELIDDRLVEGIHYSIMFYGGRLLSHLTADDPEVGEFISLRRLNRHIAILIDSDKRSSRGHINATKKRVRKEFDDERKPGFAWITGCRTIENYVPLDILEAAMEAVHPHAKLAYAGGAWDDPLQLIKPQYVDKVRIAHAACDRWTADRLDRFDLLRRIQEVVRFVWEANGFDGPRRR